jgi:starch-binding outer membrane protein, SusD/RagB family
MKKKHVFIAAALLVGVGIYSCKKELNPTKDSVVQTAITPRYLNSIVLGTYTQLQSITGNTNIILTSEETTDALIIPERIGGDWSDGGEWSTLWLHTYEPGHANVSSSWDNCYNALGQINITIDLLKGLPASSATAASINELRALRAYYYYLLVKNFGQVPLIESSSTDASTIKSSPASTVLAFVISELKAVGPTLSAKTPAQDPSQYGRINKWAAYFLLAKAYLNQNVITGTTDNSGFTACSTLCDSIITAGYSLTPNFLDNFSSNNTGSPENIFVIPYDHIYAPGLQIQMMTFHYNQAAKYNWGSTGGPWNGFCANADYYGKFNNSDARKAGWQHGIQYAADGITPLTTRGSDSSLVLNFRPQVSSLTNATEYDGVRQQKWQITPGYQSMDADFALFRYSDVLLMKAECVLRTSGDVPTALSYIAPVRQRAGLANFTAAAFNTDSLLAERGREFVWEGWRREDLIRFGHFGDKKQFKSPDGDIHSQLFPVPTEAIQKNPNLSQNPGYIQ